MLMMIIKLVLIFTVTVIVGYFITEHEKTYKDDVEETIETPTETEENEEENEEENTED